MSKVFFTFNDTSSGGTGNELWVTDGTPAGSHIVKDISGASAFPQLLTNVDGTLYFIAYDDLSDGFIELEKSDGTAAGTKPVVIIPDSGNPALPKQDVSPNPAELVNVGGTLFLTADDTIHGRELWTVTPAGTAALVKDIVPGSFGSNAEGLININGTLFFTATDLVHGQELWKSDGTAAGTVMVKDINVGIPTSGIGYFPNVEGTLFFSANDGVHGSELWVSDGTAAGTVMVKDINPGSGDTTFSSGANFHGELLFTADDGTHGKQVWKSDGTAAGTSVFSNLDANFNRSAELNGFLYFAGNDGTHGIELWRTDGTAAGTTMVADINPSGDFDPRSLININGTLYFTATDGSHGRELWKSDGSAAGTTMVVDLVSGSGASSPNELINADGTLYFRANDGTGASLWKTDGTAGGTIKLSGFTTVTGLDDVAASSSTVRSGSELLVNTNTAGDQTQPSVAALLDGRFVEVWTDTSHIGGDASGSAIHGQIFNADGSKSGSEFLVNTTTANNQSAPVVSTLADGEFYVVWQDFSSGTNFDIRSQVFHANGTRNGAEKAETISAGEQTHPAIVSLPDMTSFPVWVDANTAAQGSINITDIVFQFLDISGVFSGIGTHNEAPAVAAAADARYLVAWASDINTLGDNSGFSIRAQVFDTAFNLVGGSLHVNTTTAGDQIAPAAAALPNGNFVIVWEDHSSSGGDISGSAIRGQIVDAAAQPVGSEFLVNVTTTGDQTSPSIAALADGRFVVVFADTSAGDGDHSGTAIRAEVLNADGTRAGEDFVINATTSGDQIAPKVTVLSDGRFVVTWDDNSQSGGDTAGHAVRSQIIDPREHGVTVAGTSFNDDFAGSSLNDVLSGGPGDDHLAGGGGKDSLSGGDGNDILNGGPGNDNLDGGPGTDTAVFAGPRSTYTITHLSSGVQASGPDGIDVLSNIEFAMFDDVTIDLNPAPANSAPVITSNGGGDSAAVSISENTTAVTTVTATDPDAGTTLSYSISGGADAALFQINTSTGALAFIAAPNFEQPTDADHNNSYIVQVRASDASLFDDQVLTVNVADVLEHPGWLATVDLGTHPAGYAINGIGDFNGDGTSDVLWFNSTTRDVDLWKISNGQWAGSVDVGTHPAGYAIAGTGDFNHDGTGDVLWYNPATTDVDIWKISNGQWAGSTDVGGHPASYAIAGTGDFNGDGTTDVLWYNSTTRDVDIWKIANGQWAGSVDVGTHPAGWTPAGVGDFNGDGTSDVLWYNPATNDAEVWKISNGQWAASVDIGTHPAGYAPVGVGDFSADGTSDVLWFNSATGDVDIWKIANGQWAGSFDIGTHPAGWTPAGVGDFNHDGTSDILWREANTGHTEVWLLSNH